VGKQKRLEKNRMEEETDRREKVEARAGTKEKKKKESSKRFH